MSRVYCIKPLEKKSIIWYIEMYRKNADDSISWFNIIETYRWGQGFIDEELACNLPWEGDRVANARNDCGWGSELEDSCAIDWEFSDDLSEDEQEFIKQCYYDGNPEDDNIPDIGGAAWLFDGIHDWCVEDDYLEIIGPYQISFCEDDGTIIEENIKLSPRPDPNTSWPWSQDNPKPKE